MSGHGSDDTDIFTSKDKLYLLAPKEIYADWSYDYDTGKDKTRQLDYYKNNEVTTTNRSRAIKKNNGSDAWWWLRSAYSNNRYYFYVVSKSGDWYNYYANYTHGVSPAFRIG